MRTLQIAIIASVIIFGVLGNIDNAFAVETWTLGDTGDAAGTTTMNSVSMFDANTGIAVGQLGVIVFTSDGGVTWTLGDVTSDAAATNELNGVSMTSANDAVAVGQGGTIVHTSDGGVTWTLGDTGDAATTTYMNEVSMTSANDGVAVGDDGVIVHTDDGGVTWTLGDTGDTAGTGSIRDVSMVSATEGVAVGTSALIIYTDDGGVTWTAGDNTNAGGSQLLGVSMTSANNGVAVGGTGLVIFTSDGGATWTLGDVTSDAAGVNTLHSVSMTSATVGVAVGGTGLVIFTSDGAVTWTEGDTTNDAASINQLREVSMTSATQGVAVGVSGTIVYAGTTSPSTVPAETGGGGGCTGDCEAPTLGVNKDGRQLVDDGFSYNGNPVDVERFFTPYPLVTVDVGKKNVAEFKIYENHGPDRVAHFELAFGLGKGESIDKSQATIIWDKTFDGIQTVELDDPDNTLENVFVITSEVLCQEDGAQMCLLLQIHHTFRAPLEFNVLGTNVWDIKRNSWHNYYNHGIEVKGESQNPPLTKTIPGPEKYEGLITVTQTELYGNMWASDDGRIFEIWENGSFKLVPQEKLREVDNTKFSERNDSGFENYKNLINERYILIFDASELQKQIPESFAYEFPDVDSRTQFLIDSGLLDFVRK